MSEQDRRSERRCNRVICQLSGFHTRDCDRAAMKSELTASNPTLSDSELETALDDLNAMERAIHPNTEGAR